MIFDAVARWLGIHANDIQSKRSQVDATYRARCRLEEAKAINANMADALEQLSSEMRDLACEKKNGSHGA